MTEDVKEEEKVTPLADRVFCEMIQDSPESIGGIIIPETSQNKPRKAVVIAVGEGHLMPDGQLIPLRVKAGDKVILAEFCGSDLKINDNEYRMVTEKDCLAIIG